VVVPTDPSPEEKEIVEKLSSVASTDVRQHLYRDGR